MTKIQKIKEYMSLCGVIQKDILATNTYTKSKPWLSNVLSGKVPMPQGEYEQIMRAISEARAKKIKGEANETNVDESEN